MNIRQILRKLITISKRNTDIELIRKEFLKAPKGSRSQRIWEARLIKLTNKEVFEKAKKCTNSYQAYKEYDAIRYNPSLVKAKKIWKNKWLKLSYRFAKEESKKCDSAEKAYSMIFSGNRAYNMVSLSIVCEEKKAQKIWQRKWIELSKKEAESCNDTEYAKQKYLNTSSDRESLEEVENKVKRIWEARWIQLNYKL